MIVRLLKLAMVVVLGAGFSAAQAPDFVGAASYATTGSSAQIAVGDFNGDGRPDIATYESATQSLSLLLGNADGTYQAGVAQALNSPANSMVAADFNGDGVADLALSTGSFVAVLINNGGAGFAPPAFYSASVSANFVTAADMNHDGFSDLVVAGSNGFAVLRGLGNGAFTAPVVLQTSFGHYSVMAVDFNGDGKLDLVGDGSPGTFYAGNGDGTFAAPLSITTVPTGSIAGDFNGDGKLDFASISTGFSREVASTQTVSIALGTGDGHFLPYMSIVYIAPGYGLITAGDFNGDGITDLAIWLSSGATVQVLRGGRLAPPFSLLDASAAGVNLAKLISADLDRNGSKDLALLAPGAVTVYRNSHGNPPLLAQAAIAPGTVIGGASTQGTVTLGGPAPAGGAVVSLSSSNPDLAYAQSATVTVLEGQSSASFPLQTLAVAAPTAVTISASWNSVAQTATVNLVAPYTLASIALTPTSQYGTFSAQGTVTLSGPADSTATVSLTSSNPAVASVPLSITVPAGATSASFTIALQPVAANTPVTISASLGGATQAAQLTVLKPLDTVAVTRAEDVVSKFQLRVEATSTSATTSLAVWNGATGAFIGTLSNAGGGKYSGQFTVPSAVLSVLVKSNLGGFATGNVTQK